MPRGPSALFLFLLLCFGACSSNNGDNGPKASTPATGSWRMDLMIGPKRIPFRFDLELKENRTWGVRMYNAEETILVDDVTLSGDSIRIRMPLYDSEFIGVVRSSDRIEGSWHNYLRGPDYTIPFVATSGKQGRFITKNRASTNVSGQWAARFTPDDGDEYPGIGLFQQDASGLITGTFLTETGDYRYLEGVLSGDSLLLSCFDGSHAFLFEARILNDSMEGRFWSGTHWQTAWTALRDDRATLRHPDSLTRLREGYDMVDFRFPDLQGRLVSPKDEAYKEKVLLVQIMGSWCPNCVDETRLLNEMYGRYHDQGLEIISIAFEKQADTSRAIEGLKRFRDVLDVRFPILYAGSSSKASASEKLPFLDHVMSFPTCIMVDRRGHVRRIRTGIYGPSTGAHYIAYRNHLGAFLEQLLAENAGPVLAGR